MINIIKTKKTGILLAMFLNLGAASAVHSFPNSNNLNVTDAYLELEKSKYGNGLVPVGTIDVKHIEMITLKPDVINFSVTVYSEGLTLTEASEINDKKIKEFKDYLIKLGLSDKSLTSVGYDNQEKEEIVYKKVAGIERQYKARYSIFISIEDNDSFMKVKEVLGQHNIYELVGESQTPNSDSYNFIINAIANSEKEADKKARDIYYAIVEKLNKLNLDTTSIAATDVSAYSPDGLKEKHQTITHRLAISTDKIDEIGKIIGKAQELDIIVNNDARYDVSTKAKQKAIEDVEPLLLQKLEDKATSFLSKKYILGAPTRIDITDLAIVEKLNNNYSFEDRGSMRMGIGMDRYLKKGVDISIQSEQKMQLIITGTFEMLKQKVNE